MEPALPLDYVEFDPHVEHTGDISEMSAEQYLSWVRTQASSLPSVVRVEVDCSKYLSKQTTYMPTLVDIPTCPEELIPAEDWIRSVIHSFSELRMSLNKASISDSSKERKIAVPQLKDRDSWFKFCFGDDLSPTLTSEEEEQVQESNLGSIEVRKAKLVDQFNSILSNSEYDNNSEEDGDSVDEEREVVHGAPQQWQGDVKVTPSAALMLQFDQVLTQRLLGYHIDWLCSSVDVRTRIDCGGSGGGRLRRSVAALSELQSQWLYSLLSRLEKPLHSDMTAAIRSLYRTCCQLRYASALPDSTAGDEDRDNQEEEELARLNILIAICGSYFGQSEELACLYEGEHAGDAHEDDGESMEEDEEFGDDVEEGEDDEGEGEGEGEDGVEKMEEEEGEEECMGKKRRRLLQSEVVGNSGGSYELEDGEEIE